MGEVHVVVGGQYGSEGKGHVTAWLTKHIGASRVIRVAGPNAGHSAYDQNGQKWALRQVPIAAVVDDHVNLYIAAGSEIDPEVLFDEITRLQIAGIPITDRLHIDDSATVIEPHHKDLETNRNLVGRIGSTGKGIGAARSDRILREAATWGRFVADTENEEWADTFRATTCYSVSTLMYNYLAAGEKVIIEGTQGYGLGLHTDYYPQTTSSDARAVDFLSMAGISPWQLDVDVHVWPVFRTYPIRVAGNSGPMFKELDWADLAERTHGHIQPERTTVTQKVRRVGEWDDALAVQAMRANGGPGPNVHPVLLFLDYIFPELAGEADARRFGVDQWDYINRIQNVLRSDINYVGTGPDTIVELR
jgi:adenylosuccinate synthase